MASFFRQPVSQVIDLIRGQRDMLLVKEDAQVKVRS